MQINSAPSGGLSWTEQDACVRRGEAVAFKLVPTGQVNGSG